MTSLDHTIREKLAEHDRAGVVVMILLVALAAFGWRAYNVHGSIDSRVLWWGAGLLGWWAGLANLSLPVRLAGWLGCVAAVHASQMVLWALWNPYPHANQNQFFFFFSSGNGYWPLLPAIDAAVFLLYGFLLARRGILLAADTAAHDSSKIGVRSARRAFSVADLLLLTTVSACAISLMATVAPRHFYSYAAEFIRNNPSFMAKLILTIFPLTVTDTLLIMAVSWLFLSQSRWIKRFVLLLGAWLGDLACFLGVVVLQGTMTSGVEIIEWIWDMLSRSAVFAVVFLVVRLGGYRFQRYRT